MRPKGRSGMSPKEGITGSALFLDTWSARLSMSHVVWYPPKAIDSSSSNDCGSIAEESGAAETATVGCDFSTELVADAEKRVSWDALCSGASSVNRRMVYCNSETSSELD